MTTLVETISTVAARIADYRERRVRLTESDTIRVLVLPVLKALGWDLHDVEEVRSEYRHMASDNPVDYALFLQGAPALFVEAKALGMSLDDRKPLIQTLNYANAAGVDWCALTNGSEWRIYKVHAPVAAEEKLFLTVCLDDPKPTLDAAATVLSLLSLGRLQARAIDALWSEWRVDRQVEAALEDISGDEAFIRLITKRTPGLTGGDVRTSLRRAGLRSFYPKIETFMARVEEDQGPTLSGERDRGDKAPVADVDPDQAPMPRMARAQLMKTSEMVQRGLLTIGTPLTIKDRPDSKATVVGGKTVEFRGETMSFNEWGCRATGWTAIQIYKWAVLPDGRLLEALREGTT